MVYLAYLEARKNERNKQSQLEFELHLEDNLRNLREVLFRRTYEPSPPYCFMITRPTKREIFAPAFVDRVVSHVLFSILYSNIDPLFIHDSFSCRVNKGTLCGIKRFEHHLRSCTNNFTENGYVLYIDIAGYFMNIDKAILEQEIYRLIDSHSWDIDVEFTKWLTKVIIYKPSTQNCIIKGDRREWKDFPPHKSLFNSPEGKGLIIGDLTSQLFSNVYLNILDQYIKHQLKCKHYCRYVDDLRIIHKDKNFLKKVLQDIEQYLNDSLKLGLSKNKIKIVPTYARQEFLGAVIIKHKRYATKRTLKNFAGRVRNLEGLDVAVQLNSLNSYLGYLSHFRSGRHKKNLLLGFSNTFDFDNYYNKVTIKKEQQ